MKQLTYGVWEQLIHYLSTLLLITQIQRKWFNDLSYKNGKEIYEGDIVRTNKSKYKRFDEDGIYEVYFNKFLCHYALIASRCEWEHKHEQYDNYELTGAKTKDFEVIGNIHKNKELMKGLC